MLRTVYQIVRTLLVMVIGVVTLLSATPGLAQATPVPPYVTAAFADLSQRLGKTYTPANGLAGSWSFSEITLDANDQSLGCPLYKGAPIPGQKGAWQILITLNNIGNFDYRASLNGKVVIYCTGPTGVNSAAVPQASQPPAAPSQNPVTYEAPVVAYIDARSGNVYVTSMRPNAGPTALTLDSASKADSSLTFGTSVLYSRLTWSPDGTSLAFTRLGDAGAYDLFVATSGQSVKKLASLHATNFAAAWSPDGSEIAYAVRADSSASAAEETYQVQAISRNGGQPHFVGAFTVPTAATGYMPHDPSDAIAMLDTLVDSGVLVWTKSGVIHSLGNSFNFGLALNGFDGKKVWSLDTVDRAVVSPDRSHAIARQGQQAVLIDLATGQTSPFPAQINPDVMAWGPDGQTIYYSTSTKLSEVQIKANAAGARLLEQIDGGLPLTSAVSNTVQLWSVPVSDGKPTALFGMEGYAIGAISVSPVPNNSLISFSIIASSAKLYSDVNAGRTDLAQDYPTIRVGTVVPGQAPILFDDASRKPAISSVAEFVAVPVAASVSAANNAPTVCSKASSTPVTLTVVNKTSQPVVLMWIDFKCNEVQNGVINPGTSFVQQTYTGHVWRIEDAQSHQVLKEFSMTQSMTVALP